jgi:hypothetical protein
LVLLSVEAHEASSSLESDFSQSQRTTMVG